MELGNGLKARSLLMVERIAQAVKSQASDGTAQVIYYHEGIGTWDEIDKLLGGAFGIGIDQHI